jgi:predicted nuclease of predicted toxin-antitoxin system
MALVRSLRDAGHDVSSVQERCPGATDKAVAELALAEGRVLLTEDKDFGQFVHASSPRSPGIVLLRFPAGARGIMAVQLNRLLEDHGESLAGCFAIVEPGRMRVGPRR